MFRLCTIFVLLSAAVYSDAAVAVFPLEEKPAEFVHQEGCYLKHLNKVIPYGDYYADNECAKYTCFSTNETQKLTCGVTVIDPTSSCKLISDETQKYPDCCPKAVCSTVPPEATSKVTDPVSEHQTTEEAVKTNLLATEIPGTIDSVVPETSEANESSSTETSATLALYSITYDEATNELLIAQASIKQTVQTT